MNYNAYSEQMVLDGVQKSFSYPLLKKTLLNNPLDTVQLQVLVK